MPRKSKHPRLQVWCRENGVSYDNAVTLIRNRHPDVAEDEVIAYYTFLASGGKRSDFPWSDGHTAHAQRRKGRIIRRDVLHKGLFAACTECGVSYQNARINWRDHHPTVPESEAIAWVRAKAEGRQFRWSDTVPRKEKPKPYKLKKLKAFADEHGLRYESMQHYRLLHGLTEDETLECYSGKLKAATEPSVRVPEKEKPSGHAFSLKRQKCEWSAADPPERESITPVVVDGITYTERQGNVLIGQASPEFLAELDAKISQHVQRIGSNPNLRRKEFLV